MIINWIGHSCFKIKTKPERGEDVVILMDPFDQVINSKTTSLKTDIITASHPHCTHSNNKKITDKKTFYIDSPGEYSIKNVIIEGFESFHDKSKGEERGRNIIFTIESEGIKICHLGGLGHILDDKQIDSLGSIDILMIPVGGNHTVNAREAEEIIGQLEPKIIIPMHHKTATIDLEIDPVDVFLNEFGTEVKEKLEKLVIKSKDLEDVENKVLLLEPLSS